MLYECYMSATQALHESYMSAIRVLYECCLSALCEVCASHMCAIFSTKGTRVAKPESMEPTKSV